MAWVRSGPANVEIDGAVRYAINKLGYVKIEAAAELADLIAQDWPGFCSNGRALRERPDLLTEKGLANRSRAVLAMRCHIAFHVWQVVFDGSEQIWSKHCSNVRLSARVKACCAVSRPLDGLLLPREQRFALPLLECDAEWCSCRWLQEPDPL